ncbi:CRISPR-associated endonuclease Cas2 [Gloeobacter morelensis]|uniref:CRISPR-associated endonuclease Cas2 n=1 Tax=Gloeobacter morelensis TaxID=2907343 RepID=UPI003AB9392B
MLLTLNSGEPYGNRVQLSVFECDISDKLLTELKTKLRKKVRLEEDSVRFYVISHHTRGQVEVWNGPPVVQPAGSVVI